MFRYCETKHLLQEIVIHPSFAWIFLNTRNYWYTKGMPYQMFRNCEAKYFQRKTVKVVPSSFVLELFYTSFCLEIRKAPRRNVLVLWDKKTSTQNRDTHPLSYPCIFCYQKVSETQKASEFWKYEKFQYCERQKYSTENWAALSLTQKNFETGNFLEHKRGPLRNVSALWDK